MSGQEDMTVVGCVAAIVSAYQDGTDLLRDVQDRERQKPADNRPSQDLGLSMGRGQEVVKSQYERDFKRLGAPFATGDPIARDTLKDIVLRMQKQVISNLKVAWQRGTPVDYLLLQDVSDDSQDRAIMCLMQLHQRLLVAAPIESISGVVARPVNPPIGKPQGFIDDGPPPPRSHLGQAINQPLGNYVEISGGIDADSERKSRNRFMPGFHKKSSDEREHRAPSTMRGAVGHFVPPHEYNRYYDDKSSEHFYDKQGNDRGRESPPRDYYREPDYEPEQPPTPKPAFHQDQPCGDSLVDRYSTVSSLSSLGSGEQDHPEFNPWASGDASVSPIHSIVDEIAASNPYRNPLVPEALEPRRNRESQYTFNSRATSATLNMPLEMAHGRIDSYGSPVTGDNNVHKPWVTDVDSIYSADSRSNTSYPSYYRSQSPNENTRYNNILATRGNKYKHYDTWDEEDTVQSRSPPNPSYTWMPPKPVVRKLERGSPPVMQMQFPSPPSRPPPPPDHERPFQRSPPTSMPPPRNEYILPLHAGPPPTAPPDRPIPVPVPRVPERAANRPRGLSNVSGSNSNNSPITPITPPTPMSPEITSAPLTSQPAPALLSRHESNKTASTNPGSVTVPRGGPPLKVIAPITTGSTKAYLPSEANKYAGFCKGAWRNQIGDMKKTWEERSRPAGLYAKMITFMKCQKCYFEGRSMKVQGQKKGTVDMKVYGSNGILYRWEFLFKSHMHVEKSGTSTLESHYGCMFCCAAGKGTPVFAGVAALLAHLQEHREVLPEGEILYRMHAIVGRSPDPEEDFHVALPALVI